MGRRQNPCVHATVGKIELHDTRRPQQGRDRYRFYLQQQANHQRGRRGRSEGVGCKRQGIQNDARHERTQRFVFHVARGGSRSVAKL